MKRQLWVMMIIVGAWAVSVRGQVAVESFRKSKLNADTSQSLGLQFDYLSGNSEILMLKPTYRIDFMTPVGQSFVVANLQYGNRSGVNSVNQGLIHWRVMQPWSEHTFGELFFQKEYNDFRLISDRMLFGLSYRYVWADLLDNMGVRLATGVGIMNERETENRVATTEHLRLSTYVAIVLAESDMTFTSATYVQPSLVDINDFRVLSDNQFTFQLRPNVSFRCSAVVSYDNSPAPGVKTLDLSVSNGIALNF
ncbi:DUF481 domain-containing protein [bacterium]|nr:DUF481 domain-containing protein [bacterium]